MNTLPQALGFKQGHFVRPGLVLLFAIAACGRSSGSRQARDARAANGPTPDTSTNDAVESGLEASQSRDSADAGDGGAADAPTANEAASTNNGIEAGSDDGKSLGTLDAMLDAEPADSRWSRDYVTDLPAIDFAAIDLAPVPGASLTMTPLMLDFGTTAVGVPKGPMTFRVTNVGPTASGPVTVVKKDDAASAGGRSQFSFTTTCGSPLAPGEGCDILVTLDAILSGNASAVLTASDGTVSSEDRTVVGFVAHEYIPENPCVSSSPSGIYDPSAVYFEDTLVGQTSAAVVCTLRNRGSGTDSGAITVTTTGPFAVSENNCRTSLAPGEDCTFSLVFKPAAKGQTNGMVMWAATHGSAGMQSLNGTGLGAVEIREYRATCTPSQGCRITPDGQVSNYDFGQVSVGDTSKTQVVLAVFVRVPAGSLDVTNTFSTPSDFIQDSAASVAWPTGNGDTMVSPCKPVQTLAALPDKAIPTCTMLMTFAPQSKLPARKTGTVAATGGDGTRDTATVNGEAIGPLSENILAVVDLYSLFTRIKTH